MYVVGFISSDGILGRTFLAADWNEAEKAYSELCDENYEEYRDFDHFIDSCSLNNDKGTYFIGQLESVDT